MSFNDDPFVLSENDPAYNIQYYIELERKLLSIDGTNYEPVLNFILDNDYIVSTIRYINILAFNIPQHGIIYSKLIMDILKQKEVDISCLKFRPLIAIQLALNGYLTVIHNKKSYYFGFYCSVITKQLTYYPSELSDFMTESELAANDFQIIKELIEYGYPINSLGYILRFDLVDKLLEYIKNSVLFNSDQDLYCLDLTNSFLERQQAKKYKLLTICALYGSISCFKVLYARRAILDMECYKMSVIGGNREIIQILLNDDRLRGDRYGELLGVALKCHRNEIVEWMMDNFQTKEISLTDATKALNFEYIYRILSSQTYDINDSESDDYCKTPLICAAERGITELCELYIRLGATVDQVDSDDNTALIIAAHKGNLHVCELLLDNNADVNVQNQFSYTALMKASENGYHKVVALLLSHNASLDCRSSFGFTPLICAARNGHVNVCRILVSYGASVNQKDSEEHTALYHAAGNGQLETCRFLIEVGASINFKGRFNFTPLYIAKQNNHVEVVQLLKSKGGEEYTNVKSQNY